MTLADLKQQSINEKVDTLKHLFADDEHTMLQEMVSLNYNWDTEYPKAFDKDTFGRFKGMSDLLERLNNKKRPASGHLVKIICHNGKVYEQALLRLIGETCEISVNGGGFIVSENLSINGLSMSVCGGYTLKIDVKHLQELDRYSKNYRFSGTGKIEANCGINICRTIKRWILDDSDGHLGFY